MGVFFRGDDSQRVEGLLRALKLTKRAQDAAIMPSNGVQAMPWVAGGALATVLGPVKGAAATAGIGGLARAYESAPVRNLLMKLPTVKPGSAEEGAIFKRLTALGVTKDEPTTTEGEQ